MFSPKDYLYTIAAKRKEYFTQVLREENLNLLEAEILMFLHTNPDENTLTKIINAKDFAKSHVSTAITNLENDGYLTRSATSKNKKTLKLSLLPKSEALLNKLFDCLKNFHQKAFNGISEAEINEMERLLGKICSNLKEND